VGTSFTTVADAGFGRVDDLDAVVGGADVDVLPLPRNAPDRFGVVTVIRTGDRHRLDVLGAVGLVTSQMLMPRPPIVTM
jgi:hypothetical protein